MNDKSRLAYIDVFRGIAVALMIIVNNQGDWNHVYRIFRHASWHGFLGADIVFPFFLFIMGVSIPFSINKHIKNGTSKKHIAEKIIRRTLILIALGMFINLLPYFDFATMRIPGVLQRIGLCYGATALAYLFMKPRGQRVAAFGMLVLYGAALLCITPQGFGVNPLLPNTTICFFIDRAIFAGHTYAHAPVAGFDPEGLVSTLPAIVSTMTGCFVCDFIEKNNSPESHQLRTNRNLLSSGLALIACGISLSPILPINKNLWTPSYVLVTSGLANIVLTGLKLLDEHSNVKNWSLPLRWLGTNSLFAYIVSSAVGKLFAMLPVSLSSTPATLKSIIVSSVFARWLSPHAASFFYAFFFLVVWIAVCGVLYRKGVVVKV